MTQIDDEQVVLDRAFARRDGLLADLAGQLEADGVADATEIARRTGLRRRRAELVRAEQGLVFGRLDAADGTVRHLGRVGVPDDDGNPMVLDWRAPAARPFYTATPLAPEGQVRRRHIRTQGRRVIGVDDEPLDETVGGELVGEGALLTALSRRRTGRMGTAVATLQREQDDIIRHDHRGPLVVQGGPGTGKTVVALHRVAYLLFSLPQLAERGVLVVGPSARFLDYIAQVLPALGETQVVSTTCDRLLPGVRPDREESRAVAEVKGRSTWQRALVGYVESLLPEPSDLRLELDAEEHLIPRAQVADALRVARADGRDYHAARRWFVQRAHDLLVDAVVERREALLARMEEGFEDILARVDAGLLRADDRAVSQQVRGVDVDGVLSDDDVDRLRARIEDDVRVAHALDVWWPRRDPSDLLRSLLCSRDLLARWLPDLTAAEVDAVVSESDAGWSTNDVALLDALADLLGDDFPEQAQGEFLAERAAARRDWAYGHVVVDEAQELSPMQWHMLLRRCPSRSVTAVGDIDQAEAPHRHTSWEEAVGEVLGGRWVQRRLTLCYRTPREVMELTRPVLERAGSSNEPPRAVRDSGFDPWVRSCPEAELLAVTSECVTELRSRHAGGTVGVVVPRVRVARLRAAMPDVLVLSATEAKGLEFDAVLVVDPDGITQEPRGWNGLYVALTRCTQELGQVQLGLP